MGFMFGRYRPVTEQAEPLLRSGDALITVTSSKTGRHVTLRARCFSTGPRIVPWDEAERVVFTDFDGEIVATYRPAIGALVPVITAPGRDVWTVGAVLRYLAGEFPLLAEKADVDVVYADGRSTVAA